MKYLLIVCSLLISTLAWCQPTDKYVKSIEKLRSNGKLTTKSSVDKTFVGSVTSYFYKDSLVLISSMTDAEFAGTETQYFIKDGTLMKVFIMNASITSSDEWKEYFARHKALDDCYACHGKPNCTTTEITFGKKPMIVFIENKTRKELTEDSKSKLLIDATRTFDELKMLVKEL